MVAFTPQEGGICGCRTGTATTEKRSRPRDICNATIALLAKVGYAETTIAGVAQEAGFSKGAVQYHFPSKEELIAATVEHLLMRTVASASQRYESVESALMNAWQRLINTSAYRALLEALNAARTTVSCACASRRNCWRGKSGSTVFRYLSKRKYRTGVPAG